MFHDSEDSSDESDPTYVIQESWMAVQSTIRHLQLLLKQTTAADNDSTVESNIQFLNNLNYSVQQIDTLNTNFEDLVQNRTDTFSILTEELPLYEEVRNFFQQVYAEHSRIQEQLQMNNWNKDEIIEALTIWIDELDLEGNELMKKLGYIQPYYVEKMQAEEQQNTPRRISWSPELKRVLQLVIDHLDPLSMTFTSLNAILENVAEAKFGISNIVKIYYDDQQDRKAVAVIMTNFRGMYKELILLLQHVKEPDADFETANRALKTTMGRIHRIVRRLLVIANTDEDAPPSPSVVGSSSRKSRNSLGQAWSEALDTVQPVRDLAGPPRCQVPAVLFPSTNQALDYDILFGSLLWSTGMSEQFFYDNSLLLILHHKDGLTALSSALRLNYQNKDLEIIGKEWIDVAFLGSGGFGDVVEVTVKSTQQKLAIKYLRMSEEDEKERNMIMEYLIERNYLIRARNSPFVVKFLESLRLDGVRGLFLVFEWCLGDLARLLAAEERSLGYRDPPFDEELWNNTPGFMVKHMAVLSGLWGEDMMRVSLVFVFELLCVLDYLASCNIVHRDIKPQNVMVGADLHLRIADMGLVQNTQLILDLPHIMPISSDDLNNEPGILQGGGGTKIYLDMEITLKKLQNEKPILANHLILNDAPLYDEEIGFDIASYTVDMWAMGLTIVQVLFMNFELFYGIDSLTMEQAGVLSDSPYYDLAVKVLSFTMHRYRYSRYIQLGLQKAAGPELEELMAFIASIFVPRHSRARSYVKFKTHGFLTKYRTVAVIDMSKIEALSVFSAMRLTTSNVFLVKMPTSLIPRLHKPTTTIFDTFHTYVMKNSNKMKADFLPMKPGIPLSFL